MHPLFTRRAVCTAGLALVVGTGHAQAADLGMAGAHHQGQAGKVLAQAHKGTGLYEQQSGKPGAKLVNVAGRQRMLSQRMAQFYLANAWHVDSAASLREMARARDEFTPALELLRHAPEATPEIQQTLALADAQWVFFDNALKARVNTTRSATDVFVTSENLLQVMDRVTTQYARILG